MPAAAADAAATSRVGSPSAAAGHLQRVCDAEPAYNLVMLKRAKLGGRLFVVGARVTVSGHGSLRAAWGLVSTGQARAADERTRTMVELYGLERLAVPA